MSRFWGIKLKPKAVQKVKIPPLHTLHVTKAVVEKPRDSTDDSGRYYVTVKTGRSPEKIIICALTSEHDQSSLDLKISSGPPPPPPKKNQRDNPAPQKSKGGNRILSLRGQPLKKRGKSKRKQPDLLEMDIPPPGGKKGGKDKDDDDENFKSRTTKRTLAPVAEFSLLGDWGRVVHLTGYTTPTSSGQNVAPAATLPIAFFENEQEQGDEETEEKGQVQKEIDSENEEDLRAELAGLEGNLEQQDGEGGEGFEDGDEGEVSDIEKLLQGKEKKALFEDEDDGEQEVKTPTAAKKQKTDNPPKAAKPEVAQKQKTKNKKKAQQQPAADVDGDAAVEPGTVESAIGGVKILKLPSGVQIQEVKVGAGKTAKKGSLLKVRYKGMLHGGEVFDTNLPKKAPFVFKCGSSDVIQGWNYGIIGMKAGGKRNILIPAHLGYGAKGSPPEIPPNAPLVFELHLLSVD